MLSFLLFIIPIFFVIRPFRDMAYHYERHRGGYAFLAVGVYLVSYFIFGIIVAIIASRMIEPTAEDTFATFNQRVERSYWVAFLVTILLSSLTVTGLYYLLKSAWKKNPKRNVDTTSDLLDR